MSFLFIFVFVLKIQLFYSNIVFLEKNQTDLFLVSNNDLSEINNSSNNFMIDYIDLKYNNTVNYEIQDNYDDEIFNLRIDVDTTNCIFVRSDEGVYSFYSKSIYNEVCGLYSIAEPNQLIEFEFEHFNVSCSTDKTDKSSLSLLSVVDGWELNGQFFPGLNDHLINKQSRYSEFCTNDMKNFKKIFRVSQNVGLIQFKILNKFEGFKVKIRFIENLRPCNVLFRMPQGVYTLQNYGKKINCSISTLFPESITLISIINKIKNNNLNNLNKNNSLVSENNLCVNDYVELKGGNGLDTDLMMMADKMCISKNSNHLKVEIDCDNTAVRLVSSGSFESFVTIGFDLLEKSNVLDNIKTEKNERLTFKCPIKSYKGQF